MNSSKQPKKHSSTTPNETETTTVEQPILADRDSAISEQDVKNSQDHAVEELETEQNMARDRSMMD